MRVRMRRRYRGGTLLSKREFVDQSWLSGILTLRSVEGRLQLGLWNSGPGDVAPPRSPSARLPRQPARLLRGRRQLSPGFTAPSRGPLAGTGA